MHLRFFRPGASAPRPAEKWGTLDVAQAPRLGDGFWGSDELSTRLYRHSPFLKPALALCVGWEFVCTGPNGRIEWRSDRSIRRRDCQGLRPAGQCKWRIV